MCKVYACLAFKKKRNRVDERKVYALRCMQRCMTTNSQEGVLKMAMKNNRERMEKCASKAASNDFFGSHSVALYAYSVDDGCAKCKHDCETPGLHIHPSESDDFGEVSEVDRARMVGEAHLDAECGSHDFITIVAAEGLSLERRLSEKEKKMLRRKSTTKWGREEKKERETKAETAEDRRKKEVSAKRRAERELSQDEELVNKQAHGRESAQERKVEKERKESKLYRGAGMERPAKLPPSELPCLFSPGGVLEIIVKHTLETAPRPQPALALNSAIALLGTVLGREFETESGLRTNMYMLSVARSGSGKEHPRKVAAKILSETGMFDRLGGDEVSSGSAVMSMLHKNPCRLVQMDEFGLFMTEAQEGAADSHKAGIIKIMMRMFSNAGSLVVGNEMSTLSAKKGAGNGEKRR